MSACLEHFALRSEPFSKEIEDDKLWLPESKRNIVDELVDCVHERKHAVVTGEPGVGKTTLAWATGRELLEHQHVPTVLVTFRDLLWDMRRSFDTHEPCELAHRCQTVQLLILDDLGAERSTEWARSELATLIERRYTAQLATIVTSNYTAAELGARIGHDDRAEGHRIIGRLVENASLIRMGGTSYRIPGKEA